MSTNNIQRKVTALLDSLFDNKMGLWLNFTGTVLIAATTTFTNGIRVGGAGRESYPFVIAVHPEWLKLGLILITLGFIIQILEGSSLRMKIVNFVIFLAIYFGVSFVSGA